MNARLRRPALALLLLAAVVLLPVFARPRVWLPGPTYNMLFVLDITQSMNVPDARSDGTPRLAAARQALLDALRALPCGSRASVGLFADSESVVLFEPLEVCDHFPAMEQVVRGVDWRMAWSGNSQIDAGLSSAMREAGERKLDLVFITDGDQKPLRRAVRLAPLHRLRGSTRGWLVGVGGEQPRPVPKFDAQNRVVGYWEPGEATRQGFNPNLVSVDDGMSLTTGDGSVHTPDEHLSGLHEPEMKDLARAAGLDYLRLAHGAALLRAVADPRLATLNPAPRDLRWAFALLALALLLAGWLWRERAA